MGLYLIRKHEIDPYPEGLRVIIKGSEFPCIVEGQCPCTSDLLHYLARLSDGTVISVQHFDVVPELSEPSDLPY